MIKLTDDRIESLLNEEESEHLDFKLKHHKNTSELVHDILCLSNSDYNGDRFIVFGIDNNKNIIGLVGERRNQACLIDCLRSSSFNLLPTLLMYTITISEKEIDIIHISNSPNKPYFLLKDKVDGKVRIRTGVIYTRDNDTNTPTDSTASVSQIEKMWRERFGIDKSPLERVTNYIYDIPGWQTANEKEYYYKNYPEFKITTDKESLSHDFHECWINKKFPCKLGIVQVYVYFHSTLLTKYDIINLEHKIYFPIPEYFDTENVYENDKAFINNNKIDNYVCAILNKIKDNNYYDDTFNKRYNLHLPINIYFNSLRQNISIHSLNIEITNDE